jgi:hypothetical protein
MEIKKSCLFKISSSSSFKNSVKCPKNDIDNDNDIVLYGPNLKFIAKPSEI